MVRRPYTLRERQELETGAWALGLSAGAAYAALGYDTRDIYLNDATYWRNIPAGVWDYAIGGYPALRKWLSYRCDGILGRELTEAEAEYFTQTARRITALRLLEPELNHNYALIRDASLLEY